MRKRALSVGRNRKQVAMASELSGKMVSIAVEANMVRGIEAG